MAFTSHIICFIFLFNLMLIFSNLLVSIEARHLKHKKLKLSSTHAYNIKVDDDDKGHHDVDAFRPTTPGHSPGSGHSIINKKDVVASPGLKLLHQNSQGIKAEDDGRDKEAFRPTTPGHSPGIGHSLGQLNQEAHREEALLDTNAFRPTTPGHSPGVGNSIHN